MKVRDVIGLIEATAGCSCDSVEATGSSKHATRAGTVTIAGKDSQDLPRGTLNSVLRQAGLKEQ
jgi:hypothetical protein